MQVLPSFSASACLVGIKVIKRDKCQFGENQSKIRFIFFFLNFSSSSISGLKTYLRFSLTVYMGMMHIRFLMRNLGCRVSDLFSSGKIRFILRNLHSFLDEI